MSRVTVSAGTWAPEKRPAPVVYSVNAERGCVWFNVCHTDRDSGHERGVHGQGLTADEARALGRALLLAGMEAS